MGGAMYNSQTGTSDEKFERSNGNIMIVEV